MDKNDPHRYDDIIDLPHHVSETRPQMPRMSRAAQFAPFAALTGHDAAIRETGRRTERKKNLDEQPKYMLDATLRWLRDHQDAQPEVALTYFAYDDRKFGGHYETVRGCLVRLDLSRRRIVLTSGDQVPIDELSDIDCPAE